MSTRNSPYVGCVTRNAGHGTHHHFERGTPIPSWARRRIRLPPLASNMPGGDCSSPPSKGSTVTVVPSGPPGNGPSSGFGSA